MELPVVTDNALKGEKGVARVNAIVSDIGFIFRETPKHDFGIDGEIEIVVQENKDRHATGRLIAIQIKYGSAYLVNEQEDHYVHYCSKAHANYWLGHSLHVIIALCDPETSDCYWVLVDQASLETTKEGAKICVPKANLLTKASLNLAQIANSGSLGVPEKPEAIYEFLLNDQYAISLANDELAVLCAEISWAFKEEKKISIQVEFENEALVAQEADEIRLTENPTVQQRKRLLELKEMHAWFSAKRGHIARGIRMLLKEDFIRLAGIETSDPPSGSIAVRAFVEYYIFHRMGQNKPAATCLDIFPETLINSGPIAKVFLNEKDKKAFAQKHNLDDDLTLLKWPGFNFIDLPYDLRLSRGLPAVVTALLFYLDQNNISEEEFFSRTEGLLYEWRLGLS